MAVSGEEAALSPLHRAVRGHDLRAIAQLGTHAGTAGHGDVRLTLGEGSDLYSSAVQCQHVSPVREGAVASSCVHLAAVLGHTDTLAYLLARGGQLEARDQAGCTPLMLGIQWLMNGCVKCVAFFHNFSLKALVATFNEEKTVLYNCSPLFCIVLKRKVINTGFPKYQCGKCCCLYPCIGSAAARAERGQRAAAAGAGGQRDRGGQGG